VVSRLRCLSFVRPHLFLLGQTGEKGLKEWELVEESVELKLRLSLLIRLLVTKGIISAEEHAAMIAQAHSQSPESPL
jgi:hypothetical protein